MLIKRRPLPQKTPNLPNYSPLLQRIFASRGITAEIELDYRLEQLLNYENLTQVQRAASRVAHAIFEQQRIIVIGDFDADGATSTALAVSALKSMGCNNVSYLVPNRFEFGYGLTPAIVEAAKKRQPNLIITVDNGITSIEGVEFANQSNIEVIITDHHLPGDKLPNAYAIVNPAQNKDTFQSKAIAGVGVIFYLMTALRTHLDKSGWFNVRKKPNMAQFLDLVALGTVADVVSLDKNNRILVRSGLNRIRQGKTSFGIQALILTAGKEQNYLRESDLGFAIAPRLNAAGRLDDMSLGIECLLAQDLDTALKLANQLNDLNKERRGIEAQMKIQALTAVEKLKNLQEMPLALCLMDDWHQGVIGIIAGRLKELYHRPVIIFARINADELKGSARSIPGLNIRDILANINALQPNLLKKFGGHAMAAGLSIDPKDFDLFKTVFNNEVAKHLTLDACKQILLTDGELTAEELNLDSAKLIHELGPWGQHFPEPIFDNTFILHDQRIIADKHLKLSVSHPDSTDEINAIAFNVNLEQWPNHRAAKIVGAYKLNINRYKGYESLQLMMEFIKVIN